MFKLILAMGYFKRLLTDSGFVAFWDYFGLFLIQMERDNIRSLILPFTFESKIDSKEPKNRQKLNPLTVSKTICDS
jgi:hypothetical protein